MFKRTLLLALGLSLAPPASAEIIVGLNGGIVISGDQDLAFKEYAADSNLARRVDTDMCANPSARWPARA